MQPMTTLWTEVADGVFARRYRFFDQNIVAIVDRGEAVVVDTRSTYRQAREILDDLRELGAPRIAAVINTHGHFDHAFGNRIFRPAPIWGHERAVAMLTPEGRQREFMAEELPKLAAELDEIELDPPDRVFAERAVVEVGRRRLDLAFLGRGHTDNDIIVATEDRSAILAGDLLENAACPYFGDGYPMEWPATAEAILAMAGDGTVIVPGHGDPAGRTYWARQAGQIAENAALARRIHAGELDLEAAIAVSPFPPDAAREPLERAGAQLRGELD